MRGQSTARYLLLCTLPSQLAPKLSTSSPSYALAPERVYSRPAFDGWSPSPYPCVAAVPLPGVSAAPPIAWPPPDHQACEGGYESSSWIDLHTRELGGVRAPAGCNRHQERSKERSQKCVRVCVWGVKSLAALLLLTRGQGGERETRSITCVVVHSVWAYHIKRTLFTPTKVGTTSSFLASRKILLRTKHEMKVSYIHTTRQRK